MTTRHWGERERGVSDGGGGEAAEFDGITQIVQSSKPSTNVNYRRTRCFRVMKEPLLVETKNEQLAGAGSF